MGILQIQIQFVLYDSPEQEVFSWQYLVIFGLMTCFLLYYFKRSKDNMKEEYE